MNIKNVKKRETLTFEQFLKVTDKPFDKKNLSKEKRDGFNTIKREKAYDYVGYADPIFKHQSKIDYPSIFDPHQQGTADVGITENSKNKQKMKNKQINEFKENVERRVLSFDQFIEKFDLAPSIEEETPEMAMDTDMGTDMDMDTESEEMDMEMDSEEGEMDMDSEEGEMDMDSEEEEDLDIDMEEDEDSGEEETEEEIEDEEGEEE
jgi:hypothetical protein